MNIFKRNEFCDSVTCFLRTAKFAWLLDAGMVVTLKISGSPGLVVQIYLVFLILLKQA